MKKPRKGRRKGKRKGGGQNTTQPAPPHSTLRVLLSHWWGKAVALIVTLLGLIGTAFGVYQMIDQMRAIYFQTIPEIHVAGSEPNNPLALPFTVKNGSNWFDMKDVRWICRVKYLNTKAGFSLRDSQIGATFSWPDIKTNRTENFTCRVNSGEITSAKIIGEVSYKTLWFQRLTETMEFNWISGRWIEGALH